MKTEWIANLQRFYRHDWEYTKNSKSKEIAEKLQKIVNKKCSWQRITDKEEQWLKETQEKWLIESEEKINTWQGLRST